MVERLSVYLVKDAIVLCDGQRELYCTQGASLIPFIEKDRNEKRMVKTSDVPHRQL
jgi:hypothetical protein